MKDGMQRLRIALCYHAMLFAYRVCILASHEILQVHTLSLGSCLGQANG